MRTEGEMQVLLRALHRPEVLSKARKTLIEIGAPAVPLLINALGDNDISLIAAGMLSEIGAVAVEPLIDALENKNKKISAYAAIALEDIGLPSVEPLITALKSKDHRTRLFAVRALGHIGDDRAVDPLTNVFNEAARLGKKDVLLAATIESLRKLGKVVEGPALESKGARSPKSQKLLLEFIEELKKRRFEVSSRSERLYYHPHIAGIRFVICQRVIRLEHRKKKGLRWRLVRSFSILHETHLALENIDAIL